MKKSRKMSRITMAWILVACMVVPMVSFVATTKASKASVPDSQNYDAMTISEIMDLGDSLTWVFTGDSITHNTHFTMGMNGHADWFEQYIKDIPKRLNDKVVNSAWGGSQIQDFQTDENTPSGQGPDEDKGQGVRNYVTKYNPDVVFIKLGMNNRGTTKSTFVDYYKKMLDAIYDICASEYGKRPKIILLSPTPMVGENLYDDKVNPEPQRLFADSTLNRTNDIREIAEEYELIFCDLRNAFLEEQLVLGADYRHTFFHDSSDGTVHPNAAGQYFMFKTWSKTLGIYDETNPIYQIEYDDINSAALYTDETSDDGNTGDVTEAQEMNKTMPILTTAGKDKLIASIDFNAVNGMFDGTTTKASLTDTGICNDVLTLDEAKALGKEFSVVFRAKLDVTSESYQTMFYLSDQSAEYRKAAVFLGVPGKATSGSYASENNSNFNADPKRSGVMLRYPETIVDEWHTVAIVQGTDGCKVYVDGEVKDVKYNIGNSKYTGDLDIVTLKKDLGSYFANSTEVVAYIGGNADDAAGYKAKGAMDFYQLYSGALTAGEVAQLSGTVDKEALEMNKEMLTLTTEAKEHLIASVDFTAENGKIDGSVSKVSLTDSNICNNVLTLDEAKALGKEFSIVFRAKLEATAESYQPVLYLSDQSAEYKKAAVILGVPGKATSGSYASGNSGNFVADPSRSGIMLKYPESTVGEWCTVAIVQGVDGCKVYVDGVLKDIKYNTSSGYVGDLSTVTLKNDLGSYFTNATTVEAYIGGSAEDSSKYILKGAMDFYQLYDVALDSAEVAKLAGVTVTEPQDKASWADTIKENSVWMVAGAEQMSGYTGSEVNRSMFRMIDNAIRFKEVHRDIRMWDAAATGYTVEKLNEEYDNIIGKYTHNVFLLLPEVSQVYAEGYTHSPEAVAAYKASVQELLKKEKEAGNVRILWTPLASNNAILNRYLNDYAKAVREIAKEDTSILFFDANQFMNEKMMSNGSLVRNWFEEEMYISPLCSTDLVQEFFVLLTTDVKATNTGIAETKEHNLRYTSDIRVFKGDYVRDYLKPNNVSVSGETVTVDITDIKAKYTLDSVSFAVMPETATGNYHKDIYHIENVAVSGNTYTFTAPCSNPIIAVYGKVGDLIYRFKDFTVAVTASQDLTRVPANPDGVYLDGLQVVGAPSIGYSKNTFSYDVDLYQYQSSIQLFVTAQKGLKITANGKEIESEKNSHLIDVESNPTVKVVVTDTIHADRDPVTYTLNLSKPEYPDIIITEIMQDGYDADGNEKTEDDKYDLIEIYNASGKDLNLLDYSIGYKKDFRKTEGDVEYLYPNYYFTGNNEAFQSDNKDIAEVERPETYTGINQITKYSSYWNDGSVTEPAEVTFKADSTMVIWVLAAGKGSTPQEAEAFGEALSYDTLIQTLTDDKDVNVLSVDGKAVVPDKEQLVVAEIPKGVETESLVGIARDTAEDSTDYFYLDNHIGDNEKNTPNARKWLFVLKDTATQATNGAITEAGDDIISAARTIRLGGMKNLSNVLSYNTERGMSLVKNEGFYDDENFSTTSDVQGYGNKTTFGAIEYWQKPADSDDLTAPIVKNNTANTVFQGQKAEINLELSDNIDVRYVELYIRQEGETEFTKVGKDFVLEAGMQSAGVSKDTTSKVYTYVIEGITGSVEYYGFVLDGNYNKTTFGKENKPLEIQYVVPGTLDVSMTVRNEDGDIETKEVEVNVTVEIEKESGKSTEAATLKNHEKLSIKDLPEGTKYTVKIDVPAGYEAKADVITGKVSYTVPAKAEFDLQERRYGDLKLSMTIENADGTKENKAKASVKIVLTGDELSGAYSIVDKNGAKVGMIEAGSKSGEITMKHGDEVYLKDLPPSIGYTVTVTAPKGYADVTDVTEFIGSIKKGKEVAVSMKMSNEDSVAFLRDVSTNGNASSDGENPSTGDTNQIFLWFLLLGTSLAVCYMSKRKWMR